MASVARGASVLRILLLSLYSITVLYPLLWMIRLSLGDLQGMYASPWRIIPDQWKWDNFQSAWKVGQIGTALYNTLFITFISLLLIVAFCYLGSYALARMRFAGRGFLMMLFVSTMLLPLQIILIPLYRIDVLFGINNSHLGLILPYIAAGLPISIFLMTAFLRTIPFELEESAAIDGCSRLRLIVSILFPLSRPGLATVVIFQFMNIWNEFPLALTVLNNPDLRTVTLALTSFKGQWGLMDFNKLFAALTITTMPLVLMFILFQRQFISGLTSGALKG